MHPLDGAYVRLARAEEHLSNLKVISATLVDVEKEAIIDNLRATVQLNPFKFELGPERPIPLGYSVLIGEIIYNLRASLDYLVYELAILDSGFEQEKTQFPIYESERGFTRRPETCLGGVNVAHTAAIERLQPYHGINWTKWLQSLSNPDKHRHLVVTQHGGSVSWTTTPDPSYIDVLNPPVHVNLHIEEMFIAFDDGLPIVDTLEEIKTEVANVLAYFKLEF